jgi:hypothetical protein
MLYLARSYNLFPAPNGTFHAAAFDYEYSDAMRWAYDRYNPDRHQGQVWEDFVRHRAEDSHWVHTCIISPSLLVLHSNSLQLAEEAP